MDLEVLNAFIWRTRQAGWVSCVIAVSSFVFCCRLYRPPLPCHRPSVLIATLVGRWRLALTGQVHPNGEDASRQNRCGRWTPQVSRWGIRMS